MDALVDILNQCQSYIKDNRFTILNYRAKNKKLLQSYGLSMEDIKGILLALKAKDFEPQVEQEKDTARNEFGQIIVAKNYQTDIVDVPLYIKIKLPSSGLQVVVISFHQNNDYS